MSVAKSRRNSRILPIVMLIILLGIAGTLASIPYMARERAPTLTEADPVAFSADLGGVWVTGNVEQVDRGSVRIRLELTPSGSQLIPRLALRMPERNMESLWPQVRPTGAGSYESRAILDMSGYWLMRIEASDGWTDVGFRLPD